MNLAGSLASIVYVHAPICSVHWSHYLHFSLQCAKEDIRLFHHKVMWSSLAANYDAIIKMLD
jgi:hypothetical protein